MTLKVLQTEMIMAMKNRDKLRKETISGLIAAIKKYAIDNKIDRENIPEEAIDAVLLKEQKSMVEMIDTCPKERESTLKEYTEKLTVINEFAPKLISNPEEIKEFIMKLNIENFDEICRNKGLFMKAVMPHLKGKVDMKVANKVIEGMLN
jgi:uncharacterized protein YqeY